MKLTILDLPDSVSILYEIQKIIKAEITNPNSISKLLLNKLASELIVSLLNKLAHNKIVHIIHIINNNINTPADFDLFAKKASLSVEIIIVIITKNTKNKIVPYVPNEEKLFKKFCCLLPSFSGKVNKMITYKKAKTAIIIVSNNE